jgi:hypothetical protein
MFPTTDIDPNADTSPDLSSSMDSFFAAPTDGATDPPQPQDDPAPEGVDANADPAAGDPTAEGDQPQDGAEESDIPEDDDEPIDTTGKKVIRIPVNRFNNIYQSHKMMREIRELVPTVEAARFQHQRANDLLDMHADMNTADPDGVDKFLGFWKREAPGGFDLMAQRAFEQASPAVQDQIRAGVITNSIEQAYQQASESGDPNDLYRAQMLEWSATGKYRAKDAIPRHDPMATREQELTRREQALQQQQQQRVNGEWSNLEGQFSRAKAQGLSAEVDKILAPVKGNFEGKPALLDALRDAIQSKVEADLGNNFEWRGSHERDLKLARKAFFDAAQNRGAFDPKQRLQPIVNDYIARARNLMAPVAKKLISEATATLVADNQAAHQRRANAPANRAPNGGGRPSAGGKAPAKGWSTLEERIASEWPA